MNICSCADGNYAYLCTNMYARLYLYMWHPEVNLMYIPYEPSNLLYNIWSLWGLLIRLVLLARECQGFVFLPPQCWGYRHRPPPHLAFYVIVCWETLLLRLPSTMSGKARQLALTACKSKKPLRKVCSLWPDYRFNFFFPYKILPRSIPTLVINIYLPLNCLPIL